MTDFGTTGIQVAPKAPTEDEMNQVTQIIQRAVNALVGMSQLQADVDTLRQTVGTLQTDTDRLRKQNEGLDEALYQSRQARQGLEAELGQVKHDLREITTERDNLLHDNDRKISQIQEYEQRLHSVEQARDDAELQVMSLEDQLKSAQTKLASIEEGFNSIFGKAKPEAVQEAKPEPEPYVAPVWDPPHVDQPTPTPTPTPEPALAPPLTSSEWKPGYSWDNSRGLYVEDPTSIF